MLSGILNGKRPMSAEMCLKVSRLAGGTPEHWMRLQAMHDLSKAEMNKKTMERVRRVPVFKDENHLINA
jgi:plasmid maintenance system antidote protein VapI